MGGSTPFIVALRAESTAAVEVETEYGGHIASPLLVDSTQHDDFPQDGGYKAFPQDGGYKAGIDPMECDPNLLDTAKAAIRIQAAGRGWLERRGAICGNMAATTIQRVVRSWLVRHIQSVKREARKKDATFLLRSVVRQWLLGKQGVDAQKASQSRVETRNGTRGRSGTRRRRVRVRGASPRARSEPQRYGEWVDSSTIDLRFRGCVKTRR